MVTIGTKWRNWYLINYFKPKDRYWTSVHVNYCIERILQNTFRPSKALLPVYTRLLLVPKLLFLVTVERAQRSKS